MDDCVSKAACMGRREFLVKAGLVAGATVLTVTSIGAAAFDDVVVPIGADSPLAKAGGSLIVDSKAGKIIVIRVDDKNFAAFSALCTHKRGELKYEGGVLACPKHGSKFDTANGAVKGGPAEDPLKSFATKGGKDSVTVVIG